MAPIFIKDPRSDTEVYISVSCLFLLLLIRGFFLISLIYRVRIQLNLTQEVDKFTKATLICLAFAFLLNFIFRAVSWTLKLL